MVKRYRMLQSDFESSFRDDFCGICVKVFYCPQFTWIPSSALAGVVERREGMR